MAESDKKASSSADLKQRTSLLDDGIGKEFLNSWKSMSAAEDDSMDFNFEIGTKGKTKAFDFSTMDMDFNLDGDFGKISSFKVDMTDLDFSPKNTGKAKERSGEDSVNRNRQGKQDSFKFSFDFNDLDTFNFEPSLTKAEKKSSKAVSADTSMCQDTKIPLAEDITIDDVISMKLPEFKMGTSLKVDALVGDLGNLASANDNDSAETANFENQSSSDEARTSMEKKLMISENETNKQSHTSEKTISADPCDPLRIHDIPVHSVYKNERLRQDPKINKISGGEQNVNAKMMAESESNHERLEFDDSSPLHVTTSQNNDNERDKIGCGDHVPAENIVGTQPERCDLDPEDAVSMKFHHDTKTGSESNNSTLEFTVTPLSSGHMVENLMPLKERETGAICSKYFSRTEKSSQLNQAFSNQTKVLSLGSQRIDAVHLISADERREEIDANDATSGSKLVDGSGSQTTELAKGEPIFLGSEKSVQDVNPVNLQVDPTCSVKQIAESSTHKCVNPMPLGLNMGPIKKLNRISVDRNKLSGLKALNRTPKPSSLNILRPAGLSNIPSNSTFGKEIKSLRKSDQNIKLQGKPPTKMVSSVDNLKKTPPVPSLKRKTLEGSNASVAAFSPLKRLSESPTLIRNFKEASAVVVKEQVCSQENLVEMNTKNVTTSVLDPWELGISKIEIPLVMGNNLNVETAEAYTKDLEDICNMLKKKHEEAKDLLVRAILNNNNLLMVNHPMYEEKIHAIQKFAARIMSKELQVCSAQQQ